MRASIAMCASSQRTSPPAPCTHQDGCAVHVGNLLLVRALPAADEVVLGIVQARLCLGLRVLLPGRACHRAWVCAGVCAFGAGAQGPARPAGTPLDQQSNSDLQHRTALTAPGLLVLLVLKARPEVALVQAGGQDEQAGGGRELGAHAAAAAAAAVAVAAPASFLPCTTIRPLAAAPTAARCHSTAGSARAVI